MEVLLNAGQMDRILHDLAGEIAAQATPDHDLAIIGIRSRGEILAQRLANYLSQELGRTVPCGTLDITLYRDDLSELASAPVVGPTDIRFPVTGKTVVLVDDVIYTGRTVRAALDELVDFGRPRRVLLAALVDRGGRELRAPQVVLWARFMSATSSKMRYRTRRVRPSGSPRCSATTPVIVSSKSWAPSHGSGTYRRAIAFSRRRKDKEMNILSVPAKKVTREEKLLRTLTEWGWKQKIFVAILVAIFGWGVVAYVYQLQNGLGVTAMREYVSWGAYITDFVFFIGISHVGALMSAILRITHAEWRKPITRMAEAITFSSLFFGALMPLVDLGRPDRILNLLLYGRIQSPVLWDLMCITTYLVGSTTFLYLPMIPDIALLRDKFTSGPRHLIYRVLALNWKGKPGQHARLERSMSLRRSWIGRSVPEPERVSSSSGRLKTPRLPPSSGGAANCLPPNRAPRL